MRNYLKQQHIGESFFTFRVATSSRLEQLSDGVFALSITLLLISPQTPKTAEELIQFTNELLSFLLSTAVIMLIWYQHYLYFCRYNLRDTTTIVLNAFLLLVVLFYVYPLKFILGFLLRYAGYVLMILLGIDFDSSGFHTLVTSVMGWETLPTIMCIYSGGYVTLMLTFALLYKHALHSKQTPSLSPMEYWLTRRSIYMFSVQAGVGCVSILVVFTAMVTMPWLAIVGGLIYFIVGPLVWTVNRWLEKEKPLSEVVLE